MLYMQGGSKAPYKSLFTAGHPGNFLSHVRVTLSEYWSLSLVIQVSSGQTFVRGGGGLEAGENVDSKACFEIVSKSQALVSYSHLAQSGLYFVPFLKQNTTTSFGVTHFPHL